MSTSKIAIGTTVIGKLGKGTISKIITRSTGYVEVSYPNGRSAKEMAFNLTDELGTALKAKPAKAEPKVLTAAEIIENKIWSAKKIFLAVNDRWNSNSSYKLACTILDKINTNGNSFMASVVEQFYSKNFLSELQAQHLAKFAVETNQF